MSRPILPKQIQKAIVLRDAGHSLSSITDKLGISASTLYRAFKKHSVERGSLTSLTIEEARNQLLNDAGFIGDLKATIASSICEDISLARQIREAISLSLEELIDDTSTPAIMKSR